MLAASLRTKHQGASCLPGGIPGHSEGAVLAKVLPGRPKAGGKDVPGSSGTGSALPEVLQGRGGTEGNVVSGLPGDVTCKAIYAIAVPCFVSHSQAHPMGNQSCSYRHPQLAPCVSVGRDMCLAHSIQITPGPDSVIRSSRTGKVPQKELGGVERKRTTIPYAGASAAHPGGGWERPETPFPVNLHL